MAIHKDSIVDVDLTSGTIHRSFLNHSIGMNDSDGDFFGVRVFKGGAPVDLTNVSVQGHFNPPVGAPIFLNAGNYISGNVATVRLPQACYNYEGPFSLAIKLVTANETVTVRIVDGMVDNTYVEGSVAPTGTVPTYQEVLAEYDQMVAATATANAAAQTAINTANTAAANCAAIVAAPYSNSATYAVGSYCTKDGKLYECTTAITTAEEWTAGHWTETKVGPEVYDLKSAIDYRDLTLDKFSNYQPIFFKAGYYYTTPAVGETSVEATTANYIGAKSDVSEGDIVTFKISNTNGETSSTIACALLDSDSKVVSKHRMINGGTIAIPQGVSYIVINNRLSLMASGYYAYIGTTINEVIQSLSTSLCFALDKNDAQTIQDGTNYDTLTNPGNYKCTSMSSAQSMTNAPAEVGHRLFVFSTSATGYIMQLAVISAASQGIIIKARIKSDTNVWYPDNTGNIKWVTMLNDSNISDQLTAFLNSTLTNNTRNLWTAGDQSFTKSKSISVAIPSGTYVISADVTSEKDGADAIGYRARIEFKSNGDIIAYDAINRNCRGSTRVELSQAIDTIKIYASNTNANSADSTSEWKNIQIEKGDFLTPYIPPKWVGTIPPVEKTDELFRMENITIIGSATQSYSFIRNYQDERNLIIDVEAKYTGARETKYVMPQIRMYYSTSDFGACPYCVGEYDEYVHKQYRMPTFPNYQTGNYVNKMYLQFIVPSGLTLNIKKLTVRYSNEMNRPIESGIKIDTHGAFLYYPAHTFPAVNAAQRCGATRCIIIPKRSSDGVWFSYHDDTFDLATTILRNADGSVIESSEYDGLPFSQIPWETYLKNLTVSIANSYGAFPGVKLMTIEQYFTLCNKTGMKPMFSTHPRYTETGAVQSLYDLAKRMGVLNKLTLKPSSVAAFGDLFPVFGNEIESYGLILQRANHTDNDVQTLINTFNNSGVDQTKVRCFIETWIDLTTTTQVQMILNAGYYASLASYAHTDPSGVTVGAISESDFLYWLDQGVTEFTSSENTSLGLNW